MQLPVAGGNNKQTRRLIYLVPLQTLHRSLLFNGVIVGVALVLLGFLRFNWFLLAFGLLVPTLSYTFYHLNKEMLSHGQYRESATFTAFADIGVLFIIALLFGNPLVLLMAPVEAPLPLLCGVIYELRRRRALMVVALALFIIVVISVSAPLPTHLSLDNLEQFVMIATVLIIGVNRLLETFRVIQAVFTDQANANLRTLDLLRELESDLKLRNAQLEQAARASDQANLAKTQFLQHMSHELRSPLNTVIGLSEIIAEDLEVFPPDVVKEQARQIYKAGQHLLSVISDVLDIAKIESGTFQVYYEVIDPIAVIKDLDPMITGLRARWPKIDFTMEVPEKLPTILAEDRRVRQILINLLDNAFKYTRQGNVSMCAGEDPEGICVTVQDSGIGISKENYRRIFEPFEQVAGQQSVGTGLGLAITRHLVIQHGGILTLESEQGHGSKFEVFLPKVETTFAEHGSGALLIVEGDKNLHSVLNHHLSRAGYSPVTVDAPDEARKLLREREFVAIMMDVFLPTADVGWQFLAEITVPNAPWRCPVLVYSNVRDTARVAATGAFYLEKPARPSTLVAAIVKAIRTEMPEAWE